MTRTAYFGREFRLILWANMPGAFHFPPEMSCNHIAVTAGRDNINVDLDEVQWGGVDWICVTSGRDMRMTLVNTFMNCRHT